MFVEKTLKIRLEEQREAIAQELENAVIEVAGDSAATMQQAINIVRSHKSD